MSGPQFRRGQVVVLRSTRESGRVESDGELDGGEYWYEVRFDRRVDNMAEEELDVLEAPDRTVQSLVLSGHWGTAQAFRTALTVERLANTNQSTFYSYRSSRIQFEPYQYKPLLKLLDSPDRRLLIADEVGLGKTIETGLILTELESRRPLERVLIICPSLLREKWREELNRKFGQDFDIYDRKGLRNYLERIRQNPGRSRLRGIVSLQAFRDQDLREQFKAEVPQLELVVIDEAHYARNPGSLTSGMLGDAARLGDAVLLLSATPLQLKTRDLFTLLNALRPTEFRDPDVFDREIQTHQGVIRAGSIIRTRDPSRLPEVVKHLRNVFFNRYFIRSKDPRVQPLLDELEAGPPAERGGWVDLERRIQELHPLSTILTRTRKRDVKEHAPIRRAYVWTCYWTQDEHRAYSQLVEGSRRGGWFSQTLTLGQIQRARQAASCLPAAIMGRSAAVADDDEAVELTDILPYEVQQSNGDDPVPTEDCAPIFVDSKFAKLQEILTEIDREEPSSKVLIFTFFKGTARYLEERINSIGLRALRIDGDVYSNPMLPEKDERAIRMRRFREDSSVRIMVSTEVGSEGLDFQFCHHLVNYDLPWNPMVVEQRIGRIDRFGQQSNVVHIHNLVVDGTVEDRILMRLYNRIKIFEESIGDLESILGTQVAELQRAYLSGTLTPDEAANRVELAARAIETNRRELEDLESNSTELFGHEEYIREELQRVGRLGRYVTNSAMLAVIRNWLHRRHPDCRIWNEDDREHVHGVRVNEGLLADIRDSTPAGSHHWSFRTGELLFTTDGEVAFRDSSLQLVNASHPLIRAAVKGLKSQLQDAGARVGRIRLLGNGEFPPGQFMLAVWSHVIDGIRKKTLIEPVVLSLSDRSVLDSELAERLLCLAIESGEEWTDSPMEQVDENDWKVLLSASRRRNQELRHREQIENETAYIRRKQALEAEYTLQKEGIETRLRTARERSREERVLRLFEAQLGKSELRFREQIRELEDGRKVSVHFSDVLAACLVQVGHFEE